MPLWIILSIFLGLSLVLVFILVGRSASVMKMKKIVADRTRPVKGVLVVRNDLKMGKGKIVAQAMHAAYQAATQENPLNSIWKYNGFKKTSLKVETEEELKEIVRKVKQLRIPYTSIIDAGRTQVEPNTHTVTFIGPWYEDEIDVVTGHLRLL
ncbi:peptidyl-tRNA hydrolase 2 [Nematocida ausubeli]|uniref:peptidyl-tRNA hydrolase n=1 Tax=Nematocida ausubeli (strain ATCC PRA-371 / ERTm2) TaxID=1913371 RepID=H8ZFL3_NEMA1|nr:peptidyl-tRNA hydrolase 2 [Nematocida ausubeli]